MRIIFMGSAELAIPSLRALLQSDQAEVVAVVTQPDRPAGRKRRLTPCPVNAFAVEQGLNVLTPEKIGAADSVDTLRALRPDLFVVAAYGQYIPSRVIDLAPHAAINVHPSLLPKYRGAAPIQWAVANGDSETGVSIIDVAEKMDAGDILRQEACPIDPNDTAGMLHEKLAVLGADLLLQAVEDIRCGAVTRTPQKESDVVEVRKLTKEDGAIDWSSSAETIRNRIRAFDPWPGSFCRLPGGEPLKVWSVQMEAASGAPGEVLDNQLLIATGEGAVRLLEIQPAGKGRMSAASFINGHPVQAGSRMG